MEGGEERLRDVLFVWFCERVFWIPRGGNLYEYLGRLRKKQFGINESPFHTGGEWLGSEYMYNSV